MSPNDLLMEEERYQLYMLQILEARKSTFCSVDQICEILELSKYKAEKNLEALQDTLLLVEEKSSITVEPTGEIHLSGITNLLLKKMRLYYLEKSPYFFMFHSFITKEMGVETQLEQLPVSRSLAYKYQKYVKKLLSEENFKLNKNQVIGSEFRLRSFVFGFYYDVFNGISNPFSVEISKMTKEIIDFLVNYQNVSIPKTKEHKLTFFINVWLTRISHGHLVKEEYTRMKDNTLKEYLMRIMVTNFSLSRGSCEKEISYFFLFLGLEEIEPTSVEEYLNLESEKDVKRITMELLTKLSQQFNSNFQKLTNYQELADGLTMINRRWLVYHFRESSFILKVQLKYFQEVNPKFEQFVRTFIGNLDDALFESTQEKNKLYYDYLFFLITKIPVEELEEPIYVCIDFSHGKSYNDYIRMMLLTLKSMHIVYEESISSMTQIYLSDFALEELICEQMIWKRPPTPDDWEEFGELLLKVRGVDHE